MIHKQFVNHVIIFYEVDDDKDEIEIILKNSWIEMKHKKI